MSGKTFNLANHRSIRLNSFIERVQAGYTCVLDGGLASELERLGANISNKLWSASLLLAETGRKLIKQVHYSYLEVGQVDILTSSSYQATIPGLLNAGIGSQQEAEQLLLLSVELAEKAREEYENRHPEDSRSILVAASIGSYGAYLADGSEYRGDHKLSKMELMDFHRDKLRILANSTADIIAFETIPCIVEAQAIAELLKEEEFCNVYAWLSFSCKDEKRISSGELFIDGIKAIVECEQILVAGINCTPPEYVSGLLESASSIKSKPFIIYSNSGEIWDSTSQQYTEKTTHKEWWEYACEWVNIGQIAIIGGCCRTSPSDISLLRKSLLTIHSLNK